MNLHAQRLPMLVTLFDYDKEQRSTLEALLDSVGYFCTSFVSTKSLIDSLSVAEPDLLIAHWRSEEEALTFIEKIKNLWPTLPFLIITGRAPDNALAHLLADSPADFLIKPIGPAEFRLRMNILATRYRPEAVKDDSLTFSDYTFNKRLAKVMLNGKQSL